MNRLEALLEPLLDRLAVKLASKVRAQLNGAVDSALDRAEDRIEEAMERLEKRLLAAANKAMADVLQQALRPVADLKAAVAPALRLQQQVQEAAEAAGMIPTEEMKAGIQTAAASSMADAMDQLRNRLTPPRPWVERPDR